MKIKERKQIYKETKSKKKGDTCTCPACGSIFLKEHYQQAFCKNKPMTQCKDLYWNTITPSKRNNTMRISPASAAYMNNRGSGYDPDEDGERTSGYMDSNWPMGIDEGPEGWDGHKY